MYNMSQSEFNEMVKDISSLNRFDLHGVKIKEQNHISRRKPIVISTLYK